MPKRSRLGKSGKTIAGTMLDVGSVRQQNLRHFQMTPYNSTDEGSRPRRVWLIDGSPLDKGQTHFDLIPFGGRFEQQLIRCKHHSNL